jgi:hypothetical protein
MPLGDLAIPPAIGSYVPAPNAPRTVTTTTAMVAADSFVVGNATGGAFTITLPTSPQWGVPYAVMKGDASANAVTVAPGAGVINGTSSLTAQNQLVLYVFDGTNWDSIAPSGVGDSAWTALTKINSWVDVSGEGVLSYRKTSAGMVVLEGAVQSGSNVRIGTLPAGYRPSAANPLNMMIPITTGGSLAGGIVNIGGLAAGSVAVYVIPGLTAPTKAQICVSFYAEA